jgi:diguanylate cyclase (GGDEF)-like protein
VEFRAHFQEKDDAQGRRILRFYLYLALALFFIDYVVFGLGQTLVISACIRLGLVLYALWILKFVEKKVFSIRFERHLLIWSIAVLVTQFLSNAFSPTNQIAHFFIDAWLCIAIPIVIPLRTGTVKQLAFGFFLSSLVVCLYKIFPGTVFKMTVMAVLLMSAYSGQAISSYIYQYRKQLLSAELELQRKNNTDPLTGIVNRREFMRVTDNELQRHARLGKSLSMLVVDIEHLKQINLQHGAHAGDIVLVEVSKRLKRATRNYDCLARYGTEQFSVLLPEANEEIANKIAMRTLTTIGAMPVAAGGKELRVSATVGVTTMLEGDTIDSMLKRAEDALHQARKEQDLREEHSMPVAAAAFS